MPTSTPVVPVSIEDRKAAVAAFRAVVRDMAGDNLKADEDFLVTVGATLARAKTIMEGSDEDAAREIALGPDGNGQPSSTFNDDPFTGDAFTDDGGASELQSDLDGDDDIADDDDGDELDN